MTAITGLILAGGLARRLHGRDKALLPLRGKPMIAHVLERLAPQVDEVLINANRNPERYAEFGRRVIADAIGEFAGPLAGLEAGLTHARNELLVSVPCDAPFLPADLVARLSAALSLHGTEAAVAYTGEQAQPVFALLRRASLPRLRAYLSSSGRKIEAWYATLNTVRVAFDEVAAFANINTLDDLQQWEHIDE